MIRPNCLRWPLSAGAAFFTSTLVALADPEPSHREAYEMNFIGGGEFREYIMDHVRGQDLWARALFRFGSAHNHMHELMSVMARHGVEAHGHADRVPAFWNRVSGGQWRTYRQNNEAAEDDSLWAQLVQATEVMHDRFHHAMYHATVLDNRMKARGAQVRDYLREDPLPDADAFPRPLLPDAPLVTTEEFRRSVWTSAPESPAWHATYQQAVVFTELLATLMTDWARYASETLDTDQRPPDFEGRIDSATWATWIGNFPEDGPDEWRYFLWSVALMDHHIREMLFWMERYNQTRSHSGSAPVCCDET